MSEDSPPEKARLLRDLPENGIIRKESEIQTMIEKLTPRTWGVDT
jgi:magnesium chelatase subunit I